MIETIIGAREAAHAARLANTAERTPVTPTLKHGAPVSTRLA